MKKILMVLMAFTMLFAALACDGGEEADKTTIDFWHMSPVGSDSYSDMQTIIRTFNESQDDYYVKGTGFSFWDYWDKINVAVSSKNAPEVGLSTLDDVQSRAEAGVLFNISDLMASDPDGIELDQMYENQLEFASYEGEYFALPFTATTRVLYYNLDMFEAAGLTEDDVPTTWSELHDVAKQLDIVEDGTITQLGFDPTYGNGKYHNYLWQAGLDFFDEDLMPTLNTQEHVDILDWMVNFNDDFTRSQLTAFGDANAMYSNGPFVAQRVAMIVEVDGIHGTLKRMGADFDYGVTYIPVPDDDGIRVNWGSGFSIELYDNKEDDPDKKQGAWEFLKYLMSEDTQMAFSEATGWIMAHKAAMQRVAEGDEILERLLEEVQYARDKVYVPYAPSWHGNDWEPYLTQALERELSPEDALEAARQHYLQKRENYYSTRD
jgi:multiple sugar transport system substrate-binding protein